MSKNKNKSNKRKKIFLALIMVVFTGFILTASTYAWFTANKTVTVNEIDVNISSSEGLQISTDASNWKAIVTNQDIINGYSGATNQLPSNTASSNPVSTVGEIDSSTGFMKMFSGSIGSSQTTGDNILTASQVTEQAGTVGDFVAFDLFFQTNKEQPVYLTSNSTVTGKGTSTGIENATRVAFIVEGYAPYGSAPTTSQALKGAVSKFIWEPNYDVHTASGISNALSTYNITTQATGATKITNLGVKANIPESANIPLKSSDTSYFGAVTPATTVTPKSGIPTNAFQEVFTAHQGVTKVRIYAWVEGQDVDCEDNASGGNILYNLQFSINDKQG